MQFLEAEVVELTRTVWETVLEMPIEPSDTDQEPVENEHTISACVHISGGWAGSVILSCPVALGTRIAAQMFELEEDEIDDELINDAVGEVVNMVGGNVKGLVPGPSQLSIPAVATGVAVQLAVPGSHPVTRVGFRSGADPVRVVLMKADDAASSDADAAESQDSTANDPATVG